MPDSVLLDFYLNNPSHRSGTNIKTYFTSNMDYEEENQRGMAGEMSSSSMAGCDRNESIFSPHRNNLPTGVTNGLIVFSWGRGEYGYDKK